MRFTGVLLSLLLGFSSTLGFQVGGGLSSSRNNAASTKLFSLQTSQVDISTGAPRNYDGLINWAQYYGLSTENTFQVTTQSGDWGAIAAQPAAAGSRVLFVPAMCRLTSDRIRTEEFADMAPYIAQYFDNADGNTKVDLACHFYLFLKVLQEYDLGDQSPFFGWLDALPRKFSTAVTFSDFEVDCLPPFVKYLANTDRYNYGLFLQVLQQLNTPTISENTKYNMEVTKWAFNVVFTRARVVFGEAEIIPMSDMINHSADSNIDVQYDGEGNVHVTLLRDVQAGDPLHKCYGQPTNPSRFLATYGFFDTTPPATYCKLFTGWEATPELKNLGFDFERMVFYVENGAIADEVWDVMLYITLEKTDPAQQQQFYQAHMAGDAQAKAQLHQYYLPQTCKGLLDHVNEMLEEISDCEATLDKSGLGSVHEHLPMIRRHNDFVRQTFTKVKKNLEQMQAGV
ncbi:M protein repeat protein [Seminavis robusta]|uniref:M protein repeat protein n=1 Tax=Seminavis robusta TaxID=568900 RepID=A0A9N8HPL1_9STRA|nr:M protein repeat protein [Seminavis robusta]|eukprot:Sro1101_g241390.1 M protein repeat protein (455) ;mRNA; f:10119-11483